MFNTRSDQSYDVIVIGNGAVGSALAYELRRRDPKARIAIIGPSARKGGATVTAGAMINVWAEMAKGQFEDAAMADRANLAIEAFGLWDAWCEGQVISYKTRTAATDDGATGDVGGELLHGLRLPPYAVEPYRAAKRAKIEAVYDKRKIADFGIHPEMVHLYENDDFFAAIDHPRERA